MWVGLQCAARAGSLLRHGIIECGLVFFSCACEYIYKTKAWEQLYIYLGGAGAKESSNQNEVERTVITANYTVHCVLRNSEYCMCYMYIYSLV